MRYKNQMDELIAAVRSGLGTLGHSVQGISKLPSKRVESLTEGKSLSEGNVVEAIGIPIYVADVSEITDFTLTKTGWYVFARIRPEDGTEVGSGTTVTGAEDFHCVQEENCVDAAIHFEVAAASKIVAVDWGTYEETFVFKATDLAVRNLDYRTTFYIYDLAPFCSWQHALTTDTAFVAGKKYYTETDGEYTLAEVEADRYALTEDATFSASKTYYTYDGDAYAAAAVTADEAVPENTYYEKFSVPVPAYYKDGYVPAADTTFQDGTTYYTEEDGVFTEAAVTTGEAVTADTYYVAGKVRATGVFEAGTTYYTKDADVYTEATVTAGDAIPAYYNHSKLHIEGMARNVVYQFGEIVDCPIEVVMPEIANDGYGAWFEIMVRLDNSYSLSVVTPSEDVRLATNNFTTPSVGICDMMFQYTTAGGVKLWRASNTKSNL